MEEEGQGTADSQGSAVRYANLRGVRHGDPAVHGRRPLRQEQEDVSSLCESCRPHPRSPFPFLCLCVSLCASTNAPILCRLLIVRWLVRRFVVGAIVFVVLCCGLLGVFSVIFYGLLLFFAKPAACYPFTASVSDAR